MVTMNISINEELVKVIDIEIKKKKYANRSEFFRDLIRKTYIDDDDFIHSKDYYELLNHNLREWNDPSNDNIFSTE